MRVDSFMMTRTSLSGKENSVYKEPALEKAKMVDNANGELSKESSAPPYSITVS